MYDPERVAGVVDQWLQDELVASRDGRNSYLDGHEVFRKALTLGNDPNNLDALKNSAHFSRFSNLLSLRQEGMINDFTLGKITHHALMFVSGGFRTNSYLLASNQGHYEELRFGRLNLPNGASTIDINSTTSLVWEACTESGNEITIEKFTDDANRANQSIYDGIQSMYQWIMEGNATVDALEEDSLPIVLTHERQRLGLTLAVSHMALITLENHGDLSKIPMLEPKSITDVSPVPHYPFS